MTKRARISRRDFSLCCLGIASRSLCCAAYGQSGRRTEAGPFRQFGNAQLLAVSPGGHQICLRFAREPVEKFTWRTDRWIHNGERQVDNSFRVVELASGKLLQTIQVAGMIDFASFFASGEALYAETSMLPNHKKERLVADLRSGSADRWTTAYLSPTCEAVDDGFVLSVEHGIARRATALVRSAVPDFGEVGRVPFSVGKQDAVDHGTRVFFSADRKTIVYGADHTIICRRTRDLSVAWTHAVDREFPFGARNFAVSPDGSHVAAAIIDTQFVPQQRKYYISLHNGHDGIERTRLQLNGSGGIGISPDGRLLAVGANAPQAGNDETMVTVHVYDAVTGQRVKTLVHDQISNNKAFLYGSFGPNGIQFTSDGKYLITSTIHTKIWEVG